MTNGGSDGFGELRRRFRAMAPTDALRASHEPPGDRFRPIRARLSRLDESFRPNPVESLRSYELSGRPGFVIVRNALSDDGLFDLARLALFDWLKWPHRSNAGDGGRPSTAAKQCWATFGYHHNWDSKVYADHEATEMPPEMVRLAKAIAYTVGYGDDYKPEASIINYYGMGSSMKAHVDRSERNLCAPLISVSLGQAAIFLLGGQSLQDEPVPLTLRHGDICVMSGESRLAYHAVARIVKDVHFENNNNNALPEVVTYLNEHRINFNIRQVN